MTKEQEIVRSVFDAYIRDAKATSTKKDRPTFDMLEEVKNMAIKALEQQPSDDCVSRQAVDHLCFKYLKPNTDDNIAFYEHFCDLPSVTPTRCIAAVRFSKKDLREICNERIEIECTHGTCKDCEHCYVISHTNNKVCEKHSCMQVSNNFYCADFEKRGDENEIN